jgi:hypothetical protein
MPGIFSAQGKFWNGYRLKENGIVIAYGRKFRCLLFCAYRNLINQARKYPPGISGRRPGRYTPGLGSRGLSPRRGIPAPD